MNDLVMAVIDGTGAWTKSAYEQDMKDSFCHQMAVSLGSSTCQYERGPSLDGIRMNERGMRAADFIASAVRQGVRRVFLAGYSRGAVAAVMAAEYLNDRRIAVNGLFLFDPVERHLSSGGEAVPSNVGAAYVAVRDYSNPIFDRYDYTIGWTIFAHNPVRKFFGSAKLSFDRRVEVHEQIFLGSHGAMGGVGFRVIPFDGCCQMEVASFMNGAFRSLRVPVTLVPVPPKG